MSESEKLFESLEQRRRDLGISQSALAALSGVSLPTVHRILAGHGSAASYANVIAVTRALGMSVEAVPMIDTETLLEQQARKKAERIVGLVQGTSSLEGQGLSRKKLSEMIHKTIDELLQGSRRRLWAK